MNTSILSAGVSLITLGLAFTTGAAAQTSAQAGSPPIVTAPEVSQSGAQPATTVQEVVVTGVRKSIIDAIQAKRTAINEVDSINAEDLSRFPDNNLAEALQRLPGVTLERTSVGDSETISVRGLSSQFTRVEINGIGAGTGGGGRSGVIETGRVEGSDGRSYDFAFTPSEFFTNAALNKSPEASDLEGGIAGTLRLSTPSPAKLGPQSLSFGALGNVFIGSDVQPRIYGIASKRFNDQWSGLFGVVYSKEQASAGETGFTRFQPLGQFSANPSLLTSQQALALAPTGTLQQIRLRHTENTALLGSLEWTPEDGTNFQFDALYIRGIGDEDVYSDAIDISSNAAVPTSLVIQNGVATSGSFPSTRAVTYTARSDRINDDDQQYDLHGDVRLSSNWTAVPYIGYTKRTSSRPFGELDFSPAHGGNFTFQNGGSLENFSTSGTTFNSNPQSLFLTDIFESGSQSSNAEYDGRLDFIGKFDFIFPTTIKFGGRYDDNRFAVDEPFRGQLNSGSAISLAPYATPQNLNIGGSGNQNAYSLNIASTDNLLLGGQNLLSPTFSTSQSKLNSIIIGSAAADQLASSRVREKNIDAYIEAITHVGAFTFDPGVRVVHTEQTAIGTESVNNVNVPVDGINNYTYALPSVNVRYDVNSALTLRVTASEALSRPSLNALSPRDTINYTTLMGSRGNPNLKPFTVTQEDVGFEWSPKKEILVAATFFNKDFSSVITDQNVTLQRIVPVNGANMSEPILFTEPVNTGAGSVRGVELIFQSNVFFGPEWLRKAGAVFNYTKLDSSTSITTVSTTQAEPFPNLSPSSYNLQGYYDNGRFDARLSYAWQAGFLRDGLDPSGNFYYQGDFGQLDATIDYHVTKFFLLQLQANNITSEELRYYSSTQRVYADRRALPASLIFGGRFRF